MTITIEKEKMEKVLEALELSAVTVDSFGVQKKTQEAITAIKQALAEPVQPVALHAMAKRRIFDAIRGAYDLGYNDARGARAVHGDSAPGYKGRDVEADHGGALFSALERYTTPSAQPAVPLTKKELRKMHHEDQFGLFCDFDEFEQIVRATEQAHGITEKGQP